MANENDASLKIGGNVNHSKVRSGKIKTVQGKDTAKNNASVSIDKDVTDSSEIEGGQIEISQSIDIAKLKAELRKEIQPFIEKLAESSITRSEAVATEAIKEEIKSKPTLKKRFLSALEAGGTEILKEIFKHPVITISIETVKGFLKSS
ncbi:hypothetical protein [Mastigocoleus testarum]|uniref:Uncharacterized protein n=1 Tax=Mastigocoleus testarum BC008 TaxID=371196 RepID=A0A0V7ZND5_9CYAN|nr:hypothetical protein [Mastigocoleus testarum]KST65545.1 hypothetical protein BC008_42235 [Mastigocoleus testarum BC008]KST66067.1 hypothetical protein BC008_24120 [Mastigocoleus testarum BC008]